MKVNSVNIFFRQNGFVKIPLIKNKIGHFQIKAKINGKTGKFILDTGASATVVNNSAAVKFKLKLQNKKSRNAGGLGESKMVVRQSINNKITLGNFKAENYKISLLDLSHVNKSLTNNGAGTIDGVIGADILKKYNAIIDYKGKALYLK